MLDFGEELTIETFKIPWLIWIQILILLLLMILLYCFSIFPLDLSAENSNHNNHRNNSSAFPSSSKISGESQMNKPAFKRSTTVTNRLEPSQRVKAQSIKGEIATSTRRRIEEMNTTAAAAAEKGSTSAKEAGSNINYHPCHYFKLARIAFLKCLGLDSENSSSTSEPEKDR